VIRRLVIVFFVGEEVAVGLDVVEGGSSLFAQRVQENVSPT